MKAVIWERCKKSESLRLCEIDRPVPKDNEILIKIHSTSLKSKNCQAKGFKIPLVYKLFGRLASYFLKSKNKIFRHEIAGEVEDIGSEVSRFTIGDRVFATTANKSILCAEYICISEKPTHSALALMPNNISYEEAACTPISAIEALYFLKIASIEAGDKVLIIGATSSLGNMALQIARYYGARVSYLDACEGDSVLINSGLDYVNEDKNNKDLSQEKNYDVIFDASGKSPFVETLNHVSTNGCYIICCANSVQKLRARTLMSKGKRRIIMGMAEERSEDLIFIRNLIESGHIKILIDKTFILEDINDAYTYVRNNQKKSNVAIRVSQEVRNYKKLCIEIK